MPENNHLRFFRVDAAPQRLLQIMRTYDMLNEKLALSQSHGFYRAISEAQIIGIAAHGGNRSDLFQLEENTRLSNVARMQDVFDALEKMRYPIVEEIVRI